MRRALALTVALLLLSCSDDDSGSSPTTTASTSTEAPADSTTTSTTTTTEPAPSAIALRGDGLGVVALGAVPDVAVAAITDELGEPSADSGWQPSGSFGACPGDRSRSVEWGGLALLFTDGSTAYGEGEHLSTWRVNDAPPPVATAKGLGYGATAADAEDLYPDHVERVPAEDPFPAFLTIDAEGGTITAYLDEADSITNLEAGAGCGE
jgi:hypothetical protein